MENTERPIEPVREKLFTAKENMVRFLVILLLGVLGYTLSLFGKIPGMQVNTFFPIEPSDVVILVAYALYGFWASFVVILLKTGLLMLTFFNALTKPIPLEGIVNFLFSFFLAFSILVMDRSFRTFHKGIFYRLLSYIFVAVFVSLMMVSLEYAFVIPIALNQYRWTTIYQVDISKMMVDHRSFFPYPNSYELSILRVFLPYNLVKTYAVCLLYEICFHQFVYRMLKSGLLDNRYFMNRYDFELAKLFVNLKTIALEYAQIKEAREKKVESLKKRNARKVLEEEPKNNTSITEYDYRYDMTIDDYGSIHDVSIVTDSESSQLIVNYMLNSHPGSKYHISSYQEGPEIVRDASSDGLSPELFKAVNGYSKEVTKIIKVSIIVRAEQ